VKSSESKLLLLLFPSAVSPTLSRSTVQPPPLDRKFVEIDQIVTLAVVDARDDKSAKIDLEKLRNFAERILAKKNFQISESDTLGVASEATWSWDGLSAASSTWISHLGPPEARWVFLIVLSSAKETNGSLSSVEILGFLYDKTTATVLWKGMGVCVPDPSGPSGPLASTVPWRNPYESPQMARIGYDEEVLELSKVIISVAGAKQRALAYAMADLLHGIPTLPRDLNQYRDAYLR
jgi:hypothetical protein